ncbi:Histidine kinase-, DNA gyrase B-, and HSP90-like ATPase [Catalinimonas alkaloidigena]|uniref:histidine kinase n=1 Tax=Catalinimonas alkaloidigena TaxID=1075417 RepID=A0A1G9P9X5_9BACT|nr:ATP-binding protein [Catalinimonas alkaloidigena]SDL94955.1 Histidine kinase-, DNA gyrase B-, and HSP90-like ATPase [Catalinimonas alkaloidigena]
MDVFGSENIYQGRSKLKLVIVVVALMIGGFSLLYTNYLVRILAEREKGMVQLTARSIEFIGNESDPGESIELATDIIESNNSIPLIWTDEKGHPISRRNINTTGMTDEEVMALLESKVQEMREVYEPIEIGSVSGKPQYVYYENSELTSTLRYYPYVQLSVITILSLMAYLVFNYSRRAEQNRVWAGLAKETAHQLGTPLSSLMAWLEYFKSDDRLKDDPVIDELGKDIRRLEMITARFSNIGSVPVLKPEDVGASIADTLNYLRPRISKKVTMDLINRLPAGVKVNLNRALFEWVIENLCKNAVDAMSGVGSIQIEIQSLRDHRIAIDITDSGKGMTKSQMKKVFDPGFTTKKRGWGLGLTLVKRIIENYHGGRIMVRRSEPGKGTTFRIFMKTSETTRAAEPQQVISDEQLA